MRATWRVMVSVFLSVIAWFERVDYESHPDAGEDDPLEEACNRHW